MATIDLKIAVLVGDNGAYSIARHEDSETDWAFMSEMLGKHDRTTGRTIHPKSEQRYIVTATVEPPVTKEVAATKVEAA